MNKAILVGIGGLALLLGLFLAYRYLVYSPVVLDPDSQAKVEGIEAGIEEKEALNAKAKKEIEKAKNDAKEAVARARIASEAREKAQARVEALESQIRALKQQARRPILTEKDAYEAMKEMGWLKESP